MGPYISGRLDGMDSDRYGWVRTHTDGFCNSRFLTEMFKYKIGIFEILGSLSRYRNFGQIRPFFRDFSGFWADFRDFRDFRDFCKIFGIFGILGSSSKFSGFLQDFRDFFKIFKISRNFVRF